MMNLKPEEKKSIRAIINKIFSDIDGGARKDILSLCGVPELCDTLNCNQNPEGFTNALMNKLIENESGFRQFFCQYICIFSKYLNDDEKRDIDFLLCRMPSPEPIKPPEPKKTAKTYLLDKKFVINYDIDEIEGEFVKGLKHSGGIVAFYFSHNSDDMLRNYILERLITVYKQKMKIQGRSYNDPPFSVTLSEEDVQSENSVFEKIKNGLGFSLLERCDHTPLDDYVVILWNWKIPSYDFTQLMIRFWNTLNSRSDTFENTNRRIILMLMNQKKPKNIRLKHERFRNITIPEKINIADVKHYVRNRLKVGGVDENQIQLCLNKFGAADFLTAYLTLIDVVKTLKGAIESHE